jgi:hypothetical protein
VIFFLYIIFSAYKRLCSDLVCIKCSVTAEKWLPILEVPVSSVKSFLENKRRDGYSIIGLEQTANSTPLDQFSFPKKTVCIKKNLFSGCFSYFSLFFCKQNLILHNDWE